MKHRTTLQVGLLVAAAVFFLSSASAQSPENSASSVSATPSSHSPRESEVPPEQEFIELSRTKKLSSLRRRPPSLRLRSSTSLPEPSTETAKPISQTTPSTPQEPPTAAPSQQPIETSSSPLTQGQREDKQVHFTGIRAAKSDRGQVFTFTFQNPEDNSVKEKQSTQSRIPARFSPVFTSQTVKRRGSVPQTSSETNQPDNSAINSGPPGDVPRVKQSGRALTPSAGAGQTNQISQSQALEEKTVPVSNDVSRTERPLKLVRVVVRPRLKTRPREGEVVLPDAQIKPDLPSPPERPLQLIIANDRQDLARENLPAPPRPNRPLKEGPSFFANQGPPEELQPQRPHEVGEPGLQILNLNEGQDPSASPEPPRIRYVKAGSLRFFPNRPRNPQELPPQILRDFAEPPTQTFSVNEDPIARENVRERPGLPVRPLRPGSIRLIPAQAFPENLPPEPARNFVEPTLQTLAANEEQDSSARENLPPRPNRPLRPGPVRFLPNLQVNPQEVPPEILRDFANANLQNLITNDKQDPRRLISTPPPRPNRPFNSAPLQFIANKPAPPEEVPPQVPQDFPPSGAQPIRGSEGQGGSANENFPRPNRPFNSEPLRFLADHPEIPPELAGQLLREISRPDLRSLPVNEEHAQSREKFQERPTTPLKTGSLISSPNLPQGLPPQQPRYFADPNLQALIENQRQSSARFDPARFDSSGQTGHLQQGPLRLSPSNQEILGEQFTHPGRDSSHADIQDQALNGRRVPYSQSTLAGLLPQLPETPTHLQPANSGPKITAFQNSPQRLNPQPNNPSAQQQPNLEGELNNVSPVSPQPSISQSTEPPSTPGTTAPPPRVQPTPQPAISNPGFFSNPQTNIPRLIIEFPSQSAPGDSSIRLQLNPNNLPTNPRPAISSQQSIPQAPVEASTPPNEPANTHNQQALPPNGGAATGPQFNAPNIPAELPPSAADLSPRTQPNTQALITNAGLALNAQAKYQALLANTGLATNAQTNTPRLPAQLPAPLAGTDVSNNLQEVLTSDGAFKATDSNIARLPNLAVQPNPRFLGANSGQATNHISNAQGLNTQIPIASSLGVQNPSSTLQPSSQTFTSNSQLALSPLSKTLAFSNQQSPLSPTLARDSSSRAELSLQTPALNPDLAINSLPNTRTLENSLTREPDIKQQPNRQVLSINQGPSLSSQSNDRKSQGEIPTTLPTVSREDLTANSELANNSSSNSQKISTELKPTDAPKSNAQVSPVDVRLTINFNSNIPGFPAQLQPPPQTNASQQNNPTLPPQVPSSLVPDASQPQTRLQLQPVNAGPVFNPSLQQFDPSQTVSSTPQTRLQLQPVNPGPVFNPSSLPQFDPSQTASSTPIRSQQNFQAPVNFGSNFNPQFNSQPFTQATPLPSQPFSQFLNSNSGSSVNAQFNTVGRPFELQSTQPTQSPTPDSFARFQQSSQFLPTNTQFNTPGRPFQIQSQQPQQDFLAHFKPNSQIFAGNAGSLNSQFNSFSQPSSRSPPTQNTFNQASPKVFTTNAGLAVNNLQFSPGLSVELLPPATSTNQRVPSRNEQPRVNFLVNSPELSADLLPPVISQSSSSSQPSLSQPSPQPPVTQFSAASLQSNAQGVPLNAGRNFPVHLLQLLPPVDPLFPQPIQIDDPPNPVDIPKPAVAALVPPPREQLTIPIDIPKPDVPALVPPPRERLNIPIDIPRPDVPALVPPPRELVNIPIEIPKPDVPALVPPPREHTDISIDIPKPDVPALVPPPRPSDLARLLPPTPTTFSFNPSNLENPNQPNAQSQQPVQTSSDNPVLILPKSSSRNQFAQGRLNPIPIEDLSKKIGFLPQNQPAPFSAPTPSQIPTIPTGPGGVLKITDIRAGQVRPIVQEIFTSGILSQPSANKAPAAQPITFIKPPVHVGLEPPLIPFSQSPQQSTAGEKSQNNLGQSPAGFLTPIKTLVPPTAQDVTSTFTLSSSQQPTTEATSSVGPTSTQQTLQTLPQPRQEGFVIFQTPTITVTTQSNQPDSPINVRVVPQGGSGLIKPNTTLTAEPVRPANPQTSLFIRPENGGTATSTQQQLFGSTTPPIGTSPVPDLSGSSVQLIQRTSAVPSQAVSRISPLDSGIIQDNFSSNPFTPQFSQPFLINPVRLSNVTFTAFHGPGTACPKLDIQHKGHRAPQFGGNLILSPGFYPHEDPLPKLCNKPPGIEGKKFNWWQILLSHGGEPSTLSRVNEAKDVKIPVLTNSCARPFETDGVPVFYNITKTDSQTYYREEIAYHRLPEAKNTFLESRGLFVWKQARSSFDAAAFLVLYTRDDTGFWVQIKNVECSLNRDLQPNLQCRSLPECLCEGGQKRCTQSVPVLTRNFPVNAFRF